MPNDCVVYGGLFRVRLHSMLYSDFYIIVAFNWFSHKSWFSCIFGYGLLCFVQCFNNCISSNNYMSEKPWKKKPLSQFAFECATEGLYFRWNDMTIWRKMSIRCAYIDLAQINIDKFQWRRHEEVDFYQKGDTDMTLEFFQEILSKR